MAISKIDASFPLHQLQLLKADSLPLGTSHNMQQYKLGDCNTKGSEKCSMG